MLSPVRRRDIVLNFSVCPSVSVCLSVCLSHLWRGSLRHVCGHTNHRTTVIHTFLESPSDLDVHPRICFSTFQKISPELASKITLYGYIMPTKGFIALRLRANYSPYSNDLHIFGKPNRPKCASQEAICSFWLKSSKLTSPKYAPKTTKFAQCGPDRRCSSPTDDTFFVFFTFSYVMHYVFLLVLSFR